MIYLPYKRCEKVGVYWDTIPSCLADGECVKDYYGPGCKGLCINKGANGIGTCA